MSKWRETYKVHPAADVFPMMSDEDLRVLGEDVKANGLKSPIIIHNPSPIDLDHACDNVLIDGRNRLEAMERAGLETNPLDAFEVDYVSYHRSPDPVAYIISANIHRRHLTKQEQADLIVAAHKAADKPRQVGEVSEGVELLTPCGAPTGLAFKPPSTGGRGNVDPVKAKAVATAKEHGISKRTIERSFAKAEGKLPEPKKVAGPHLRLKPKLNTFTGIDAARRYYLEAFAKLDRSQWDAEEEILIDAIREIVGRALKEDSRNGRAVDDRQVDLEEYLEQTAAQSADDLDIPECLDRRLRP
jgi:hypothetical protein